MSNNQTSTITETERLMVNINTTNWVTGTNRYRLNFSSPVDLRGKKASLSMYQYGIYNSTYNISSKLGNNTYQIRWINGTTYNITMPDGYYDFNALNLNIQFNLIRNKLYFENINNPSQVLYYISVSANSIQYASEINISFVPSVIPTGFQLPSGATWTVQATNRYPQLILSPGLRKLFGFTSQTSFPTSQTVPTPAVNVAFTSNTYPVLSPVFTYLLTCNMVSSNVSPVPTLFYQVPLTKSFGSLISETVAQTNGITINPSIYNFIEITLLDQEYNSLRLIDPELTISLVIEVETTTKST
jgi:hypothetical protein